MITVVLIMLAGMLAGYLLRGRKTLLRLNGRLTLWTIWLLLFFLGLSIGHNEYIMRQLPGLGLTAFWVSIAGVGGSLLTAWVLWKFHFSQKGQKG